MSDFISSFWHWYIVVPTVLGIAGCGWLLWAQSKHKVFPEAEAVGDKTTGHVWDDTLRELNNPLPRWWMMMFVLTIVFAVGYLALFPGLGSFAGTGGWTSTGSYKNEVSNANKALEPLYAKFAAADVPALQGDPQAMGIAERLFLNNCAQCHGSDGRGSKGFPNLADSDWLHGGEPARVIETIAKGRVGMMPPMAAAVGSAEDVNNLVQYVLSLSGTASDPVKASLGKAKFAACAACHGPEGKGNPLMGTPNLTDKVWLHGGGAEAVLTAIQKGRGGVMPAHEGKFNETQIKMLASYVLALSAKQ